MPRKKLSKEQKRIRKIKKLHAEQVADRKDLVKAERKEGFIKNFGRTGGLNGKGFVSAMSRDIGRAEVNRYHHLDNETLWD